MAIGLALPGGPLLGKRTAVLGLAQDKPALRAGAASGILDKPCARRSAGGRSAPRNGLFSPTKEWDRRKRTPPVSLDAAA